MASTFSFDIISDYSVADMNNAIEQSQKEMSNRYDFKGTKASLEFKDNNKSGLKITGDSDFHIDSILDIIRKKFATRSIDQRVLDLSKESTTGNFMVTKEILFKKGLDQDKAKKITSALREKFPKVKTSIQGDSVRIFSAKKDELQEIMQYLRSYQFDFPLDFNNYR